MSDFYFHLIYPLNSPKFLQRTYWYLLDTFQGHASSCKKKKNSFFSSIERNVICYRFTGTSIII